MIELLGWVAAISVLIGYFLSVHRNEPAIFNWFNFFGSLVLAYCNLVSGVMFAAFLSAAFGTIGLYGLLKGQR